MESKKSVRWLPLMMVLIALMLAAGTVFAMSETAVPWQEQSEPDIAMAQPATVRSPAEIPYTTLVDALPTSVDTLDPHVAYSPTSVQVVAQVYETLLAHKREEPDLIPQLATEWDISADAQVFTFTADRAGGADGGAGCHGCDVGSQGDQGASRGSVGTAGTDIDYGWHPGFEQQLHDLVHQVDLAAWRV